MNKEGISLRKVLVVLVIGAFVVAAFPVWGSENEGSGTWASATSELIEGEWNLRFSDRDGTIDGTLFLRGSPTMAQSQVSGRMDSDSIVFGTVSRNSDSIAFEGARNGRSVSGTWKSTTLNDHGVWHGTVTRIVAEE